jgi:hypothetical protein
MSGELAQGLAVVAVALAAVLIFGGKVSNGVSAIMELSAPIIAVLFALGAIYLAGLFMGLVK